MICDKCKEGYYYDLNSITFKPCEEGYYCPGDGSYYKCENGYYSDIGSSKCIECGCKDGCSEKWKCKTDTGCKEGYGYDSNQETCKICSKGLYGKGEFTTCDYCEENSITNSTGQKECIKCEEPKLPNKEQSECVYCELGKYYLKGKCVDCEDGYYRDKEEDLKCSRCKDNEISTPDHMQCIICQPGYYANKETNQCLECSYNTYSLGGATECQPCPLCLSCDSTIGSCGFCYPGFQLKTVDEIVICEAYPPGSISTQSVAKDCSPCPSGQYQDEEG